jgi:hypothetical protein
MERYKNSVTVVFFLVCFVGCIGVNCARNIVHLSHTGKEQAGTHPASSCPKTSSSTVYLLMDKKENEAHKNPCADVLLPTSPVRYSPELFCRWGIIVKRTGIIPIYITIHNLRM